MVVQENPGTCKKVLEHIDDDDAKMLRYRFYKFLLLSKIHWQ